MRIIFVTLAACFLLAGIAKAGTPPHSYNFGSGGTGDGQFVELTFLAMDDSSNVYILDRFGNSVSKFDSTGAFMKKWGSEGAGSGAFAFPAQLAVSGDGFVYVTDSGNDLIQKFDRDGVFLTQWTVESMGGIGVHPNGNVYVWNELVDRVQVYDPNGVLQFQFGISGFDPGELSFVRSIAIDFRGAVYVSDRDQLKIAKYTSEGSLITEWGKEGSGNSEFQSIQGMTTDEHGNIYVCELKTYSIQLFDSTGVFLTRWGYQGSVDGAFDYPTSIAISNIGQTFVADLFNDRVQVFDPVDCAPVVEVIAPGSPSVLTPGETVEITWSAHDDRGVSDVDISFVTDTRLFGTTAGDVAPSPGLLHSIDPATGAATLIGDTGFERTGSLAAHPFSGVLYGVGTIGVGGMPILYTVDPTTGAGTEVVPFLEMANVSDLTFDPETGELFAHRRLSGGDPSSTIYKVDLYTGVVSPVGNTGVDGTGGGLAFSQNRRLFLSSSPQDSSGFADLLQVNRLNASQISTGKLDLDSEFSMSPKVKAQDFDPYNGLLYGIVRDDDSDEFLVMINPATKIVTTIGLTEPDLDGLAFGPGTCIPIATGEPNDGSYMWTVPDSASGLVRVKVTATDGGGNVTVDMSDGFVHIAGTTSAQAATMKRETVLAGASPNPFQTSTSIRFRLASAGEVDLAVFDVRGRRVRSLLSGDASAGETTILWDGVDQSGHRLPPSVYFIRLRTQDGIYTRQLILSN